MLHTLHRRARQDAVGDIRVNLGRTVLHQHFCGLTQRACGVTDVVDDDALLAFDVADDGHLGDLARFFAESCADPEGIQRAVLLDVVRRNAGTEFGRAHGFASIRSPDDFRRLVPVAEWNQFEPFSHRMDASPPEKRDR